jgi:hypothetical protein
MLDMHDARTFRRFQKSAAMKAILFGASTQGTSRCLGSSGAVAQGTCDRCDQKTRLRGLAADCRLRPKLSEDQPHAKHAHASQPAVRSADKERQPLPVSGDAERPLPDARRDVHGRPKG